MRPVSVGILAGGKSIRMGQDKAFVKIEGERILERLSKELGSFSEVLLSAGSSHSYDTLGLTVLYDEKQDVGPMEGIRQVLTAAKEEYVFVCAADMPFIKKELVRYLTGYISSDHDCYVIADDEHIHPLCAIYSKAALPVIEELIREGKYRLREIFSRLRTKYISLDLTCFDKKIVRNLNTKEELVEAQKPFVFCVSGFSDSGKTGLITRLINEFIKNNLSVGVIKHDGHDSFTDAPGSDTDQYAKAGAVSTAVYSDTRWMQYSSERTDIAEMIERMRRRKAPPDIVILEGLKRSPYPKIEVLRREICDHSVCDPDTLICTVTDDVSPEDTDCPNYKTADTEGIFLCVKEYFGF